jgi:glutathione synthase
VHAPRCSDITLTGDARTTGSREEHQRGAAAAQDFDAVIMRKDPPFDSEYFYATHLLEQAEREGAQRLQQARARCVTIPKSSRSWSSRSS